MKETLRITYIILTCIVMLSFLWIFATVFVENIMYRFPPRWTYILVAFCLGALSLVMMRLMDRVQVACTKDPLRKILIHGDTHISDFINLYERLNVPFGIFDERDLGGKYVMELHGNLTDEDLDATHAIYVAHGDGNLIDSLHEFSRIEFNEQGDFVCQRFR